MTRARTTGWILFGIVVVACLWLRGQPLVPPVAAIPATPQAAPASPESTGGYSTARTSYRAGFYPQLRSANGETHDVHSVLNVVRPLAFGDYVWDTDRIPTGKVWVRIDLGRQLLSVFRDGNEIGTSVIIFGANDHPSPVGVLHIVQKSQFYFSKSYDAPMPYALRLTDDGVAIHASSVREHVATHGCIGLPLDFARLLFAETSQGDEVEIIGDNSKT
jgi:lipoprotein-anchoring transpeptidase ErfK/SrfK